MGFIRPPEAAPTLGQLLRTRRHGRRLTQVEVAELVGVTQTAVSCWESDKARPSLDNLQVLATALRIDMAKLLAALKVAPAEAAS